MWIRSSSNYKGFESSFLHCCVMGTKKSERTERESYLSCPSPRCTVLGSMLIKRLSENAHLPFDKLMALSKAEGLRYPHPSSLRRTSMYASFLGISEAPAPPRKRDLRQAGFRAAQLAYGHFPSASQKPVFRQSQKKAARLLSLKGVS